MSTGAGDPRWDESSTRDESDPGPLRADEQGDELLEGEPRDDGLPREDAPPDEDDVAARADLLPEEQAAGDSEDPHAQAEAILEESAERTEHPDADASSQTVPRTSDETAR